MLIFKRRFPKEVTTRLVWIVHSLTPQFVQTMTKRLEATENPYIEDVLENYSSLPNLTMMALGSSYWGPPSEALSLLQLELG